MNSALLRVAIGALLIFSGCDRHRDRAPIYSGTLELTEYSVGARVPGRLASVLVEEGQTVQAGALLATLDRAEQTEKDYLRAKALFEFGGMTQQEVEQAKLAWEDQRIVSPLDGIVLVKAREPGEIVAAGGTVVDLGDIARLWVRIYVPEGDISRVRMNQPASVRVDGLSNTFKGHVSYIAPSAEFTPRNVQTRDERATQTFAVKVMLDGRGPPGSGLRPGVSADVTLP